jgi:Beta-galactosidase
MVTKVKQWWTETPLRDIEGFLNLWDLQSIKMDKIPEIVDRYVKAGVNAAHLSFIQVGEGCGTDPDMFFFKSETEPNNHLDLLEAFLNEFHKNGIHVICYFNGHSFVQSFYKKHPEWVMISESGKPVLNVYATAASACPNNRDFRKWQADVIKDLCKYEIDGIFLDGDIFFANTCYCETCKSLYREKYGMEMPAKSDRKNVNWKYLRQFQIDSMTSYVGYLYDALKGYRPEALLLCNGGMRTANWTTGRQNRELMKVQDLLFSEVGYLYKDLNRSPIWRTECENKLCVTQSGGKPVIGGVAGSHKPWNYYNLPTAEVELLMFSSISAGAHNYAVFPTTQNDDSAQIYATYNINMFIKNNEKILYPSASIAKTAIVWSNRNADFYMGSSVRKTDFTEAIQGTDVGNLHMEFEGFYDTCFRNHVPVDVIDEVSLVDGSLDKYDVVMLPNIACLTEKETQSIKDFVFNGGTVISTFETSHYSETGEPQEDFTLSKVFGVSSKRNIFGPRLWDYVLFPENSNKFSDSFKGLKYIPSPAFGIEVNSTTSEEWMGYSNKLGGSYDTMKPDRDKGFLYYNKYGKGNSFYFAGTVGHTVMEWHFPDYHSIFRKLLLENSSPAIELHNAPETVSFNIRRSLNTGEILIYLTNFTGYMDRPFKNIIEIYGAEIEVKAKARNIRSIYTQNGLKYKETEKGVVIKLEKLGKFDVIALELLD